MRYLKFISDNNEVNFAQALNLLQNFFEVVVWMANDDDKDGWSVKIKKSSDKKEQFYIKTDTTTHTAKTPLDAIQTAVMSLLLWV